jgi:hypothetical protein
VWYLWKHSLLWSGTKQNLQMHLVSLLFFVSCTNMASLSRILTLALFTFQFSQAHVTAYHPKVSQGAPHLHGAWVDDPGLIEPVSDSGFTTSILSAAHYFVTVAGIFIPHFCCRILQLIIFLKMGVSKNGSVDQ